MSAYGRSRPHWMRRQLIAVEVGDPSDATSWPSASMIDAVFGELRRGGPDLGDASAEVAPGGPSVGRRPGTTGRGRVAWIASSALSGRADPVVGSLGGQRPQRRNDAVAGVLYTRNASLRRRASGTTPPAALRRSASARSTRSSGRRRHSERRVSNTVTGRSSVSAMPIARSVIAGAGDRVPWRHGMPAVRRSSDDELDRPGRNPCQRCAMRRGRGAPPDGRADAATARSPLALAAAGAGLEAHHRRRRCREADWRRSATAAGRVARWPAIVERLSASTGTASWLPWSDVIDRADRCVVDLTAPSEAPGRPAPSLVRRIDPPWATSVHRTSPCWSRHSVRGRWAGRSLARHAGDRPRPDRQPVQASRLRVPVGGDLRRLPQHLRLRPARLRCMLRNVRDAWIRAMVQERDDVVLIDAAILGPPQVWEASGHLANFSDPLVDCTNCKNRFRLDKLDDPEHLPELRQARHVHRGPPVQPDVQDPRRPGRGRRRRRLPAARDGAGHVRQLHQRAADDAQEAAVRHRPGRQGVPQRDHAAELDLPHPRVRADGDGVLRAAGRRRRSGTSTGATSASTGTSDLGIPPDQLRLRAARRRRAVALLGRHVRRRVPVPVGLRRARGHRPAHRLRPQASTPQHSGEKLDYFDPRPTSATRRTSSSRPPASPARWPRSCSRPTTRT